MTSAAGSRFESIRCLRLLRKCYLSVFEVPVGLSTSGLDRRSAVTRRDSAVALRRSDIKDLSCTRRTLTGSESWTIAHWRCLRSMVTSSLNIETISVGSAALRSRPRHIRHIRPLHRLLRSRRQRKPSARFPGSSTARPEPGSFRSCGSSWKLRDGSG